MNGMDKEQMRQTLHGEILLMRERLLSLELDLQADHRNDAKRDAQAYLQRRLAAAERMLADTEKK